MGEREFYLESLARAKEGPASTGYGDPVNQEVRFDVVKRVLRQYGPGTRYSLLDVGCGTGDLLYDLHLSGMTPAEYDGIDVMPECIEAAKTRPRILETDASFMVSSIFGVAEELTWDFVTAVAVFAIKDPEHPMKVCWEQVAEQIVWMYGAATKAVVVSLFSTQKNNILPDEMVFDPAMVLNWALSNFERVELDHSYAPHDMTLVLHVEPGKWRDRYQGGGRG